MDKINKQATVLVAELNQICTDGELDARLERHKFNKYVDRYTTQDGDTHADYVIALIKELAWARYPDMDSANPLVEVTFNLAKESGIARLRS